MESIKNGWGGSEKYESYGSINYGLYTVVDQVILEPYAGDAKIGDLSGIFCTSFFFNKSKYEIAYKIYEEPEKIIVLIHAGTRENFYEELKNYWKENK